MENLGLFEDLNIRLCQKKHIKMLQFKILM